MANFTTRNHIKVSDLWILIALYKSGDCVVVVCSAINK